MSDLEKRVEHWLEYGKEYRWSNEFMTFLSDVKTAFLAPREEEPEMRLKRYETTIDGEYVTVLKSALEWLESVALADTPPPAPLRERVKEELGVLLTENDWYKIDETADRICALFEGAGGLKPSETEWGVAILKERVNLYKARDAAEDRVKELEAAASPPPADIPPDRTPEGIAYEERGFLPPPGVAATYTPPPSEPSLREVGWLIEAPGPQWWDGFWFCTDSMDAVRFSRKLDAEKVIRETVEQVPTIQPIEFLAVEHAWSNAALARTPPQKPERWVCHGCGAEWNRQPGNHWYMDNQGKPCGPVEEAAASRS